MIRKVKKIISSLLLVVFLLPPVVKLGHRHPHFVSKDGSAEHSLVLQDNCPICNFEFSVFIPGAEDIDLQSDFPGDRYLNNYKAQNYSNLAQYSFSLRGPPDQQI
jgi:hypothetical protein